MERLLGTVNPSKIHVEKAIAKFENSYGSHLPSNSHTLFMGRSKSGKSLAAKSMFDKYQKNFFHKGHCYLFSPTAMVEDWHILFPDYFALENIIYERCTKEKLLKLFNRIKQNFEHGDGEHGPHEILSLVIIDDLANGIHSWHELDEMISTCRHFGCSVWILIQGPCYASTAQRENCWTHSITSDYANIDDLKRICQGKSINTHRSRTSDPTVPTLRELFARVNQLNDELKQPYGRLYYTQTGQKRQFFYQNGMDLRELTVKECKNAYHSTSNDSDSDSD